MRKHVMRQMITALLIAVAVPFAKAQNIFVGDILCENDTIVRPADYDSTNLKAIGVVFYVDDSSEHGWVVSLQNDGFYKWGGYGVDTELDNFTRRGSASDDLDGLNNTKTLLEVDTIAYPAFEGVDFQGGWYVPAAGQLKILYKNLKDVDESIAKVGGDVIRHIGLTYWSSTEYSDINAWYMISIGGLEHTSDGYNDHKAAHRFMVA